MDEASSNAIAEHHLFHFSLQVSNAEQCTQLLRRHGAEPCAWALESGVKPCLDAAETILNSLSLLIQCLRHQASEPACGLPEVMASLEARRPWGS